MQDRHKEIGGIQYATQEDRSDRERTVEDKGC